jgi:arylsulfatase A-like enzyme
MAFRMQSSVPDLVDLGNEPESILKLYGDDAKKPGTFARNCLLARRLAERGVRFIQLYHRGWDHHGDLAGRLPVLARDTDQPSAALLLDLKQRGMLDDTLVVWGGEFGRTVYAQGGAGHENYGRDHHGRAFSLWMAGGGIRAGLAFGATDDFGFNVVENPVPIHDLQATILHCLGIDHERLTFRYQGRQFRLTDVEGTVVKGLLA